MTGAERIRQWLRVDEQVEGRFAAIATLMARWPDTVDRHAGRYAAQLTRVYADRLEVTAVLRELTV